MGLVTVGGRRRQEDRWRAGPEKAGRKAALRSQRPPVAERSLYDWNREPRLVHEVLTQPRWPLWLQSRAERAFLAGLIWK